LLDGCAGPGVAPGQGTVGLDVDLGTDEQGGAFGALRRVRQAGQHDVDDVVHHVVFAGRNEDFGTGNGIGTVGVRLGLGPQDAQVGTAVRFGQTHGAGPFTADQTGQEGVFLFLGAVLLQGLDGAVAQTGVHAPGPVGSAHHFAHHDAERVGQALATVFHVGRQGRPAAFNILAVGFLETLGSGDHAVVETAAFFVAGTVQRGQLVFAELGAFFHDGVDQVTIDVFIATQGLVVFFGVQYFVQQKLNVASGSFVIWHGFTLSARLPLGQSTT